MKSWYMIVFLGPLFTFIEDSTGLTAPLFFSFFILNVVEWYTGIKASQFEGKSWSSQKMHRFLGKVFIYLVMLGSIRQYAIHAGGTVGDETSKVFYSWAFWAVFNYISLILIRSIFENLHQLGVKEASKIYGLLDNKVTRFLAYLTAPPDNEKSER